MSDDELDREWKPNGRPQSTMARSFSLALNDLFKIDNSLADLDAAVSEKKQKVSSQTSELEALEARLKATEERLKAASSTHTSPSPNGRGSNGRSSPHARSPISSDTFSPQSPTKRETATSPLSAEFQRPATGAGRSRPNTGAGRPNTAKREEGWQQPLPPTPGASEDDGDVPTSAPAKSNARAKKDESDSEESE